LVGWLVWWFFSRSLVRSLVGSFGYEIQWRPVHPHGFFFESRCCSTPPGIPRLVLSLDFESGQLIPALPVGVVVFVGVAVQARKAVLSVKGIVAVAVVVQAPVRITAVAPARIHGRSGVDGIQGQEIVFFLSPVLLLVKGRSKARWQGRIEATRHPRHRPGGMEGRPAAAADAAPVCARCADAERIVQVAVAAVSEWFSTTSFHLLPQLPCRNPGAATGTGSYRAIQFVVGSRRTTAAAAAAASITATATPQRASEFVVVVFVVVVTASSSAGERSPPAQLIGGGWGSGLSLLLLLLP